VGGLADGLGIALDVEPVVGDLECLADRRAITVDAGARLRAGFGKFIADETEKWGKVVKSSGAKPG